MKRSKFSKDFVHDQLATVPELHIPTAVDIFSRFSPAVLPRFRFRARDDVEVLKRVSGERGHPALIRVDQDSEFLLRDPNL